MRRVALVTVVALALAVPARAPAEPAITVTAFSLTAASPDGDYGLDGILEDIPRALTDFGVGNTQIKRLAFTLFGVVNGRKFTRGPTNCSLHVSTGEVFGYDDPTSVHDAPASSYTPTECD